jgi:hypothetical protein
MAQPSRVAIALSSLMGGASAGVAIGTVAAWTANWLNMNGKTTFGDPRNVYVAGVVFGILVAAFLSWTMSAGLEETWRRAAICFTACAGALGGGLGAYGLSLLAIMTFSEIAQYYVPAYFVLFVVIFVVSWRVNRRQRQMMGGAPVSRAA